MFLNFLVSMNNVYHVYNRGVDRRSIFLNQKDFIRFLICMREFNRVAPIGSLYELKLKKHQAQQGIETPYGFQIPLLRLKGKNEQKKKANNKNSSWEFEDPFFYAGCYSRIY